MGHLISGRNPLGGSTVGMLSPASAEEMGLDPFAARDGVLVMKAGQGYAANLGIQDGDIIRSVNGTHGRHSMRRTATRSLATAPAGGWTIVIQRGGQTITARVRL